MSQYYPQQGPFYPPEHNPEDDYIYDEDDYEYYEEDEGDSGNSPLRPILIFLGVGCLIFLCIACCVLAVGGLLVADPATLFAPTPIPGSELGHSFEGAAAPDEAVVNDKGMSLRIIDVSRNASLETAPPVEGRELIIVTVEVTNLGDSDADFNERDLLLLNSFEEAYQPMAGADVLDGALGRGTLPPGEGLEGRLAFEVIAGERDLVLAWDDGESGGRYILLE